MEHKFAKTAIILTFCFGAQTLFAYQTIPLKALPSIEKAADKNKIWLLEGMRNSYSDFDSKFNVTSTNNAANETNIIAAENVKKPGAELADPTLPLTVVPVVAAQESAPEVKGLDKDKFKLNQILISSTRKMAIVNGQLVKEGDKVDEAEIVSIAPNKVTLKGKSGDEVTISFIEKPIRGITKHTDDAPNETKKSQ